MCTAALPITSTAFLKHVSKVRISFVLKVLYQADINKGPSLPSRLEIEDQYEFLFQLMKVSPLLCALNGKRFPRGFLMCLLQWIILKSLIHKKRVVYGNLSMKKQVVVKSDIISSENEL